MAGRNRVLPLFVAGLGGLVLAAAAVAQPKEIVIGAQCDRTGAVQTIGIHICPAYQDYANLVNWRGGVEGYRIRVLEIDNEYKVPQAVEAYERHKKENAISIMLFGTPQVQALAQKLAEDRIPGTAPGFGTAAAADGQRYPYLFPIAATYWSQGAAAVSFVRDKFGGSLAGKKIAFLHLDNPAGREPLPILEELARLEKFELRTWGVPLPGVEVGAQVLDIAQRYRADFVITHLGGRAPSASIKEFKRTSYPLSKVIAFVWGAAEADIEAAGGWSVAEGYYTLQFAGVGEDYPVRREIVEMYKAQGKSPPKEMASTVYYNRGLLTSALHVEAIRLAIKAKGGAMPTPDDVRRGFEQIRDFSLGGLVPPLQLSATDHEGGGWVQIFQVKGGKLLKATDWFRAYPEVLARAIKEAK